MLWSSNLRHYGHLLGTFRQAQGFAAPYSPYLMTMHEGEHKSCRVEIVSRMQSTHGKFHIILGDQHAHFDLGGRNDLDVDALFGERLEHGLGDAGMSPHADADDRDFGDALVRNQVLITDLRRGLDRKSTRLNSSHHRIS